MYFKNVPQKCLTFCYLENALLCIDSNGGHKCYNFLFDMSNIIWGHISWQLPNAAQ